MSNPLFNQMNNNNDMNQLIQQFRQFQASFSGDPKQQVQNLLNSGKVSQAQYDRAVAMANQLSGLLK